MSLEVLVIRFLGFFALFLAVVLLILAIICEITRYFSVIKSNFSKFHRGNQIFSNGKDKNNNNNRIQRSRDAYIRGPRIIATPVD